MATLYIFNMVTVKTATCVAGDENCNPWETLGTDELRQGTFNDANGCYFRMDAYDADHDTNVYMSGITTSVKIT